MKYRQLFRLIAPVALLMSFLIPITSPAGVSALTKQQCINKYQGKAYSAAYRDSNCDKSKGGPCVMEQWGADPDAQRADCNNSHEPADPSTSGPTSGSEGCAGAETSIIKCNDANGNPVLNMIFQIVNFLAIGVGIAVVGGIVWGALLYTTSNGDSGKTQQGITTIVNSVIGLLLFIFAYALINFVVPGGVF